MKLKHAKAGGKMIALFTAAFFIGHFIGYAAEKMNPPAVPTAADGNWGLSFQEDGKPPVDLRRTQEIRYILL